MDKLFKMLEAGKMPTALDVMAALNDGTEHGWDFETSPACPYGQANEVRCQLIESPGQRCLSCY